MERSVGPPVEKLLRDKQWEFNNPDANNALLEKVVDLALDTVKGELCFGWLPSRHHDFFARAQAAAV